MKKMDEMDRNIQLHAEEWGYKTVLLALCVWTIFNAYQAYANKTKIDMLPCLILCLSICVQVISQAAMKQKMVAGDEEYKEPNKLVYAIFFAVVIVAVVLSLGVFFLLKV
ncbi:MAG: hypothetical protein IKO84_06760 [Butyrivibrio sp.]|nr:hypothetical protein [Butyrivibrio sp.]